ncbi:MAG: FAD:protein FMN transferase [Aquificaceae bacterium]|nr:FAD:protein FMN transferase [Aquificaceae bacterium]MDW8097592.1 FAD:protein FMN transferase [Aquificaceae bacterium]
MITLLFLLMFSLSLSQERLFHLMGTYALVELPEDKAYEAYRIMKGLEEKLSDYLERSEVSLVNQSAGLGCVEVSEETLEVVRKALEVSRKTGGSFDITVGSYTINFKRKALLSEREALRLVDYRKLRVEGKSLCLEERGMAIDLGGIGKGYAVQKAYERLKTPYGFISIAGDLKVWGHRRLLAVYDPIGKGLLAQGYNRKDLCLSTGGNYLRKHILGKENSLLQVTVAYKDCTLTDAYQTALLAMEDESVEKFLKENPQVGILILFKDGSLYVNPAFLQYFESLTLYPPAP